VPRPRKAVSRSMELATQINQVMGEGTVKLGNDPTFLTSFIQTSVVPIDLLFKGGLPRNRCTEIYGDYSTLKSLISLKAVAQTQNAGGVAALVDTEHSYDPEWLKQLGGDPDALLLKQPEHGEAAAEVSELLIRAGVDLLIWDSIAGIITKNASEKRSSDDTQPANTARFMSRMMPRLTSANHRTAMLFINQTRQNVGITYGNPEVVPGGRTMPFFASYRLRLTKAGKVTEDGRSYDGEKWVKTKVQTAFKIKCTLEKSKLNKPWRECWFTFDLQNACIDDVGFLINQGLETGLIEITGQSWTIPDLWESGVRGKDAFREELDESEIQWLKEQLMTESGIESPGVQLPAKSKAVVQKRQSSKGVA
jgi:recombination protein RecA